MTTLERMSFLNELRKRSVTGSLSPEQELEYQTLRANRRLRVKEMMEKGKVVDGSTSQFNAIQKRTRDLKAVSPED